MWKPWHVAFLLVAVAAAFPPALSARPCAGRGGVGCRGGGAMGMGGDQADHMGFHFLLAHRHQIRRAVTQLPDGVETVTESAEPAVGDGIRTHVRAMQARLEDGRPIHARDPLFAAIFRHAHAITMRIEETPHGVRVTETSRDPWVADLIKAHAEVVSRFLANGMAEVHRDHPVPPRR